MLAAALLTLALMMDQPPAPPKLARPETQLCMDGYGRAVSCADPVGTPLCFDTRARVIVPCEALPQDLDGPANRSARAVIGKGIDLLTTAIAINAGAVEGNKRVPTVEHRIGGGLIAIGTQILFQEAIAKGVKIGKHTLLKPDPKFATLFSRLALLGYGAVGVHNLIQADHARKARLNQ